MKIVLKQVNEIKFDKRAWIAAMHNSMEDQTKEAAHSWLRTVLRIIPVWSEASHATFYELAEAVGFPIPLGGAVTKNRRDLGFRTGKGGLEIKKRAYSYHFYYSTTLRYLAWNEYNKAVKGDGSGVFYRLRNPGPYRFQEAGAKDFESFAENAKLPNPIDFITPKRIA